MESTTIEINSLVDNKYSLWVCFEIGLNYFNIRKSFINNKELFHTLYSEVIEKALINYNSDISGADSYYSDKLEVFVKNIYTPNTNNEETLKGALECIWAGTYSIITSSKGACIVIAYSWHRYLLIEPVNCKASEFINDELYNYLLNNYNDEIMTITQYHGYS